MCAVNRFSRPIDNQFINTYSPIPFEQMMQAGAMKQQRYDQSAVAMDASVARAEQINAIPNSQDAKDRDDALNRIYTIRDKYVGKDLSNSMVIRQLNNEIRSAIDPSDIKRWESSFAGYQNYKKNEAAMTARGQQIYNPTDFTGYDSNVTGVFSDMPMMDLGAQAEAAINTFMVKPQQDYREVPLSGGRIGIEHYRDINKIYSRIDSDVDELTTNPAIQQLMERTGMNEDTFKEFLRAKAPDYEERRLGQSWDATPKVATSASGPTPGDYYNEIKTKGDVTQSNVKGKKIERENRQMHEDLNEKQNTLEKLRDKGGDLAKIEALENDIALLEESIGTHDFKLKKVKDEVDEAHTAVVNDIRDNYLADLISTGLTTSEANTLLDKASVYIEQTNPRLSIAADPELNFKDPKTGDYKRVKDDKGHIESTDFDKFNTLVKYVKETKKSIKGLDNTLHDALKEEFSQTATVNAITLHQTADQNGIRRFVGGDNKMLASLIDPAVTEQVQNFPESFVLSADSERLNDKTDKLRRYIKLSADNDSLYSFEVKTIEKLINEDGSLNLNYKLKGPDVGGDYDEAMITVKVDEPTQVTNVIKQLYLQSGGQGISELVGAMEFKNQMGVGTAAGEYNMVGGIKATVKQEDGILNVYLPNSNEPVATANSRKDLPNVLANLNVNILTRIATEE